MEIYVVQEEDTITSIALKFDISVEKLIMDNGLTEPFSLVTGQTLVITYPLQVYTVKEGDTLAEIAEEYKITVLQLLQNNPQLADREYIFPGENLVISYNNNLGSVYATGYTYPFINDEILKKSLPYLAYVLIFDYQITDNGQFIGSNNDIPIIQTANLYGTATTLVLTSFSSTGVINLEFEFEVLLNREIQNTIIENLLNILKTNGYNGVNLAFQFINTANQQLYLNYLANVSNRLHSEGYSVFLTINPGLKFDGTEVTFEKINYVDFSNISDGILFLSYDWGYTDRPPVQFSIITTSSLLDYIVSQVPLDKIRIAMPTLGYDWQLPYAAGISRANALNYDSVMALARLVNAVIHYDDTTLSAYFEYVDYNNQPHIVWFKDARSINSSLQILQSYGIKGIGIWNLLYYFSELWLIVNTQYQIIKI